MRPLFDRRRDAGRSGPKGVAAGPAGPGIATTAGDGYAAGRPPGAAPADATSQGFSMSDRDDARAGRSSHTPPPAHGWRPRAAVVDRVSRQAVLSPGRGLAFCLAVGIALGMAAAPAAGQTDAELSGWEPGPLRLSLEEAIFLALENSRAAIAARLRREEQGLALEEAEERYLPQAGNLTLTGNARSNTEETGSVSLGPSLRVPTGGTFTLSWSKPLAGQDDRSGKTSLTFRQPLLKGFGPEIDRAPLLRTRMQERINILAFRDRVASVIGSVIGAYRGALSAARRVTISREALERAQRQLEIDRALVEAGRMAPQDLVQTEASVANRQFALNDSLDALEAANSSLVNVLDLEEGGRVEPSEEPAVRPERPDPEESLKTAFERRTDWLSARLGLEIARMDLRIAENNMLPNLSLDTRVTRRGSDSENDYAVGLNLTVPLWDDGPKRALVRARNGLRRAEMALAESRQSIRIQVRRAVRSVAVALRRIDIAGEAQELAERKLEIEHLKLQQGLSSSFQIGRFEEDLVNAQRRELDAVVGYRSALDSLDRTLGTTLDRWGVSVERVGR